MRSALNVLKDWLFRPRVRPWALLTPALVLCVALPLLRPLRHPAGMSDDELLLVATVRSLVAEHDLALDPAVASTARGGVITVDGRFYSAQPPLYAVVLSALSTGLDAAGVRYDRNVDLHLYLLTVLGVTLPTALAGGVAYRVGRAFELPRRWRTLLALLVVMGTGWISYATVLNAHAPAAACLVLSVALLVRAGAAQAPGWSIASSFGAGAFAFLAAAFDPPALAAAVPMAFAVIALRLKWPVRVGAVSAWLLGAGFIVAAHTAWTWPLTGDALPGSFHPELAVAPAYPKVDPTILDPYDDGPFDDTLWLSIGRHVNRWLVAGFGPHGVLSHFPALLLAVIGTAALLHRHWPIFLKVLALTGLVSTLAVIGVICASRTVNWRDAMFANQWLVAVLPLLMLFAGPFLRRPHGGFTWTLAGLAIGFSVLTSLLGATRPLPPDGFAGYTAYESAKRLILPDRPGRVVDAPVVRGAQ
jgi:MFS family permease